jgi:hypothetical protein
MFEVFTAMKIPAVDTNVSEGRAAYIIRVK